MSFDSKERAWENAKENEEMSREDAAEIEAEELEQELMDMEAEGLETAEEVTQQMLEDFDVQAFAEMLVVKDAGNIVLAFISNAIDDAAEKIAKARIAERNKKAREEYEGWA